MKQLIFLQLLLFFFSISSHGQQIHHQMVSAQGNTSLIAKGVLINQTIGQQTVIGNSSLSNAIVGQGFQQNKISTSSKIQLIDEVVTTLHPNPFVDQIHFQFSKPISGLISIYIYDLVGRLVYSDEKEVIQNSLSLAHLHFSQNEYILKLKAKNYLFTTKIIQSK